MENFIVSARKYRPASFETVVGQKSITSTLKNAIKNEQLAQAFLFCGPRGVGKTTCARILAKTINCTNLTENFEACNECPSCKSFNELTSFNIHELDAASNNSVDDIRSLVEQVRIPPQAGKYKVYIIDEVHMLSQQAFNAFLKTLEEPPAYAKFILATTEKHKIIPTILSRCQIFDFRRITVDDIAHHLAYVAGCENIRFEEDALHMIAQKSDGALRDALSIFDQIAISSGNNITYQAVIENLNILDYDYYFNMTACVLEQNIHDALKLIDKVIENGFEGQVFLSGFAAHLRNLLVCKDSSTLPLLEASENIRRKYADFSARCSMQFLSKNLDIANKFDSEYKNSNNRRLHLEIAFMLMCNTSALQTSSAGNNEESIKKNPEPVTPTPPKPTVIYAAEQKSPESIISEQQPASNNNINIQIISIKEDEPETDASDEVQEAQADYGNNDVTAETLYDAWEVVSELFKDHNSLYSALSKRRPEFYEDKAAQFFVDNNILLTEFNQHKAKIIHEFRSRLNNNLFDIEVLISNDEQEVKKPYTTDEKYKKMIEKNPDLQKLKDQLDLELDY